MTRPSQTKEWSRQSARTILLTGATGFVGKRLLKELLTTTDHTIVCLVRAASELEAVRRGKAVSRNRRVVFLQANLESPGMGLTRETLKRLSEQVYEIYHCAASVSFDLPLHEARRINVHGTRRLLKLANMAKRNGAFNRFHHVSTAYVAGTQRGAVDAAFLPVDRARNFRNSYERSKAEAERLLREQADISVSIYRPSIVCGDTRSGVTDNFNVLYVPMRLISKGALPMLLRGAEGWVDCVGVDYVARAIVMLARQSEQRIENFHLTAGHAFTMNDLARISVEETTRFDSTTSVRCEIVSRMRWEGLRASAAVATLIPRHLGQFQRWGKRVQRGFRNFKPYEPYCSVRTRFDSVRESRMLAYQDIVQPPPLNYLRTIARYAITSKFGAAPYRELPTEVERGPISAISITAG